ncbi:ATP-binding protein [Parabacteroides sp.]
MRFNKFDIGAEIIAILTRGMYPDPKDALREYIQNGVDAKSNHINVKIRQNNIIVQDNGLGMDYQTLRKAARIGVSDKNPSKNVGFMGIGIYSAYHLCDKLTIISKKEGATPNRLTMRFADMKSTLLEQRQLRLNGEIDGDAVIDLQTLLETYVDITDPNEIAIQDFPTTGTRVELSGISEYFYSEISNIDITSKYLQDVLPLKFNASNFANAALIEAKISDACERNSSYFESVDVTLQVNSQTRELYKPYSDTDFHNNHSEGEPHILEIKDDEFFYGVAWGCLNSERRKIKNSDLRGFLIRKQGFAIGRRSSAVKHFPRGNTFFDRYIGEIIITNPNLLPNASRNDIEYSFMRERFFNALLTCTTEYDSIGNTFQENCKADSVLNEIIENVKEISNRVNTKLQNSDELLILYTKLTSYKNTLSERIKSKRIRETRMEEAKELEQKVVSLMGFIQDRISINVNKKTKYRHIQKVQKKTPDFSEFRAENTAEVPKYESLVSMISDLEFSCDERINNLLEIIDERFIQALAKNKEEYYSFLLNLRNEFLDED